jgi:hypothetical protein
LLIAFVIYLSSSNAGDIEILNSYLQLTASTQVARFFTMIDDVLTKNGKIKRARTVFQLGKHRLSSPYQNVMPKKRFVSI